jgi:hypothetical protein
MIEGIIRHKSASVVSLHSVRQQTADLCQRELIYIG